MHIVFLHFSGSNNPTGIEKPIMVNFFPSFGIKDLGAFLIACTFLGLVLALHPNVFGHPDNDLPAQEMVTPLHIVPE
jgi:quinol-cytochrome oxidoreductase complex cytochrome b subunit